MPKASSSGGKLSESLRDEQYHLQIQNMSFWPDIEMQPATPSYSGDNMSLSRPAWEPTFRPKKNKARRR
jgi:hypothetical protein